MINIITNGAAELAVSSELDGFEHNIAKIEKCFDFVDAVTSVFPQYRVVTGVARINIGLVQLVAGVALSIIFKIKANTSSNSAMEQVYYNKLAQRSFQHVLHGGANMLRGYFQTIPYMGLILYILDPRMKYFGEKNIEEADKDLFSRFSSFAARLL